MENEHREKTDNEFCKVFHKNTLTQRLLIAG